MTRSRLQALQSRILDGLKVKDPTLTDAALARAMGCDRTEISRFRSGERTMDVAELAGLLAVGADPRVVLGSLAEIGGARVELDDVAEHADVVSTALDLVSGAAGLAGVLHAAVSDGKIDKREARLALPMVDNLIERLQEIGSLLRRVLA